jgi:hypothetical protein
MARSATVDRAKHHFLTPPGSASMRGLFWAPRYSTSTIDADSKITHTVR